MKIFLRRGQFAIGDMFSIIDGIDSVPGIFPVSCLRSPVISVGTGIYGNRDISINTTSGVVRVEGPVQGNGSLVPHHHDEVRCRGDAELDPVICGGEPSLIHCQENLPGLVQGSHEIYFIGVITFFCYAGRGIAVEVSLVLVHDHVFRIYQRCHHVE